jgi:ABC-type Na+ efflux pump permease subunit
MFFESTKAARDPRFFRTVLSETVAISVFVAFFMNLFPMNLLAEIIVQPVIAAMAIFGDVAGNKPETQRARKFLNALHALAGVALLAYSAWRTYTD